MVIDIRTPKKLYFLDIDNTKTDNYTWTRPYSQCWQGVRAARHARGRDRLDFRCARRRRRRRRRRAAEHGRVEVRGRAERAVGLLLRGELGGIGAGDLVTAVSHSGRTAELLRLTELLPHDEVQLIALTGEADSPLAQRAHVQLTAAVPPGSE